MLGAGLVLHWGNQQIPPAVFSFVLRFEGIQSVIWFWLHAFGKNKLMWSGKKSHTHILLLGICEYKQVLSMYINIWHT